MNPHMLLYLDAGIVFQLVQRVHVIVRAFLDIWIGAVTLYSSYFRKRVYIDR